MRKLFIALLSALLCLLLSVSALAADGLSTFQETQTYQPGMFSDVKAGSWYEAGVRAVYTRGIMNGTGGKAFAPSQTITWAQAAAIAARIHAACGGAEIAAAEGQWDEPYLAYAAQAKLLPSTCPEGAAAASTTSPARTTAGAPWPASCWPAACWRSAWAAARGRSPCAGMRWASPPWTPWASTFPSAIPAPTPSAPSPMCR